MQHLNELGRLGLGSRMKRFSDYLIAEVNTIYKQAGIQFEASCFPLLTLLERYGPMTLREAEQKMGTSHSYISQKAKYLKQENLIEIQASERDGRSKHLSLTAKGMELIEQARPCWKNMDIAFANMLGDDEREIFQALSLLEKKMMDTSSLSKRVTEMTRAASSDVVISDYKPEYKTAFINLNLEWLEKAFVLQDFDRKILNNPEKHLIENGGDLFFALIDGKPVGTGALYPEKDSLELCKVAVDPRYRGMGIGRKLVAAGIERARKKNASKITLTSNRHKLAPAIRLYRSMGFTEVPLRDKDIKKYGKDHINIRMEMPL
jgi:ribosomal protein S18 acetylase RimI-like enzyme/DNA-binding MarR family transcriptional regulator